MGIDSVQPNWTQAWLSKGLDGCSGQVPLSTNLPGIKSTYNGFGKDGRGGGACD
jgi:hypothetical protein